MDPTSGAGRGEGLGSALLATSTKDSTDFPNHRKEETLVACSDLCQRMRVCWVSTTDFPCWPAQVVALDARVYRDTRYRRSLPLRRKDDDTLVMYFGSKQYAWVNQSKHILGWRAAIARGLHLEKKGAKYDYALREAYQYASDKEFYPRTWWCEPRCFELAAQFLSILDLRTPTNWERIKMHMTRAEEHRICWVTQEGKIPWPAQVLLPEVAAKQYPTLGVDASVNILYANEWVCMTFGICEVHKFERKSIAPFLIGLERKYHLHANDAKFTGALGEVCEYLQKPCVSPSGVFCTKPWWNVATSAGSIAVPNHHQPQLPTYESLETCVYLPGIQHPTSDKSLDLCECHLRSDSPKTFASLCNDFSCINVASHYFCDPERCCSGWRCSNRPFSRKKKPNVSPFFTADGRGWGLRIDERVEKGSFICEFIGEVIDKKQLHSRMIAKRSRAVRDCYIMKIEDGLYIDAEQKGNMARFINSSCNPNCVSQKWTFPLTGQTHVGIVSVKELSPGTEITIDYYFEGFGVQSHEKECSFHCRCGELNCSTMNEEERLHVIKLVNQKIEVLWDDGNWYTGKVMYYDSNNKRFRVHYEDGDVELLTLDSPNALKGGDGIKFRLLTPE